VNDEAVGSSVTEPVPAPASVGAGSSQFPVLRVLAIAALTGVSVGSLSVALFASPFIPVLVAVRLRRDPSPAFVVAATLAALITGGAVSAGRGDAIGLTVAIEAFLLLLVGPISIVQAHATHPDDEASAVTAQLTVMPGAPAFQPQQSPTQQPAAAPRSAWVEPQLRTGFALVLASWLAPMVLCIMLLLPVVGTTQLRASMIKGVHAQYGDLDKQCRPAGGLANAQSLCASFRDNEAQLTRLVQRHLHLGVAIVAALIVIGNAWTSHQVSLWRLRSSGIRTRPKRRIRDFEVHWSVAYLTAFGLVLALALRHPTNDFTTWAQALGWATATFGVLLIAAQGFGLLFWVLQAVHGWRLAVLIVSAIFGWLYVLVLMGALGVVDLALHPRRRVSGSLGGRGSVS
jgi:uncharacterized protein YybS (DUF2232 family)